MWLRLWQVDFADLWRSFWGVLGIGSGVLGFTEGYLWFNNPSLEVNPVFGGGKVERGCDDVGVEREGWRSLEGMGKGRAGSLRFDGIPHPGL